MKKIVLTIATAIVMLISTALPAFASDNIFAANTPEARAAVNITVADALEQSRNRTQRLTDETKIVFELEVLRLVNLLREFYFLPPLMWNDDLAHDARQHSNNMAAAGELRHGSLFADTENVAWGQMTPELVVLRWFESPGHRDNMLDPTLRSIGIGVADEPTIHPTLNRHTLFWTQNFSFSIAGSITADEALRNHTLGMQQSSLEQAIDDTDELLEHYLELLRFDLDLLFSSTALEMVGHEIERLYDAIDAGTMTREEAVHSLDNTLMAAFEILVLEMGFDPNNMDEDDADYLLFALVEWAMIMEDLIAEERMMTEQERTARERIHVVYNGTPVQFDQPPIIQNGRTLVPMRAIFEAMGAEVTWIQSTQTVQAARGTTLVTMRIGHNIMTVSSTISVDAHNFTLDVPAQIIGGRTLVPARAIAEAFGADVQWDAATQTVIITENGEWEPTAQAAPAQNNTPTTPAEVVEVTSTITFVSISNAGVITFSHTNRHGNTATLRTDRRRAINVTTSTTAVPFTHSNDNGVLVIVSNGVTHRLTEGQSVVLTNQ